MQDNQALPILNPQAIKVAWETGRLRYKLKPVQRKIYDSVNNSKELIYVINCSRRLGKTTTMAIIAIETAIRNINYQIHFGAPYQNALKDFLLPIFNQILSDCPSDLRPTWKQQEGKFIFKSGSYIRLCGANNGQFENLRGNKSDLFILDEAAQIDELDTVVKDVALPQLLTSKNPNKRIILPSTPPPTPDHPFKLYAEKAKGRGAYSEYTIEEGWYNPEEIERFIEEMGGRKATRCMRELFCKFVTDSTLQIVPEWDSTQFVKEIPKDDYFQFYTMVEGMDIGYRDFTAWILGYYDFLGAKLVIEHEVAIRENDFTTENLAKAIKEKELEYSEVNKTRFRRISDNNNLNILADLGRIHKLPFGPVSKKHGKDWMVNQLRQFIKAGKLIVHPRCKMLISSLEFGIWKKNLDEFDRSPDLGHYDFIDSLVYLVAVLMPTIQNVNPIPPLYKLNLATTMFPNGMPKNNPNSMDEEVKKIFPKLY
jgi:hypothetical protein